MLEDEFLEQYPGARGILRGNVLPHAGMPPVSANRERQVMAARAFKQENYITLHFGYSGTRLKSYLFNQHKPTC